MKAIKKVQTGLGLLLPTLAAGWAAPGFTNFFSVLFFLDMG
jgi:hypothetical protein